MTQQDDKGYNEAYGFRGNPRHIRVEAKIGGNSKILSKEYRHPHGAVEVNPPRTETMYLWKPQTARDRAEMVRKYSSGPGPRDLADRLEVAADEAEELAQE